MRILIRLVAAIMALSVGHAGAATAPGSEEERLNREVGAYFEDFLKLNPLAATFIGDPRYNDRLAIDISPEHRNAAVDLHRRYLDAVQKIAADKLSPSSRLTKAIFERECLQFLDSARFPRELLPFDQMGGMPSTFAELGGGENAQPFATVRDYDNFLKRTNDFSTWVDQAIVNMRKGVKEGVVQPRVVVEKVIPQLRAMLADDPTKSLFYKPVSNFPKAFTLADRERLTR